MRDHNVLKPYRMVWLIALTVISCTGCVKRSTYDDVQVQLDVTKTEIEIARTEKQVLAEQIKMLQIEGQELTKKAESATAETRKAREGAAAEQQITEGTLTKLKRSVAQLTATRNSLRHALEGARREAAALQSSAEAYKNRLSHEERIRTPFSSAPETSEPTPAIPPPTTVVPKTPAEPQSAVTTASASTVGSDSPRTAKTSPLPAEEGFVATIKGWLLSLWHSVFS
ncbi:exported protein of unknown function [Nitrospira sp. KM1]|uniref:hypothetical protein n=1 Tax=Nitrospira sp. KM1 TaxID=1936990 RepID=UPI0013A76E17|nr:hypothetical protein [Nitrospira sp. KM1]BCA56400.1 exported protein of unknown function [Nitrospira sp. KM1]